MIGQAEFGQYVIVMYCLDSQLMSPSLQMWMNRGWMPNRHLLYNI